MNPSQEAIEKEIREAAKKRFSTSDLRIAYMRGAMDFIKRTEERVWNEAFEFIINHTNHMPEQIDQFEDEGKRKGYLK
jgi:hypothetical protein